MTIEHKIAAAFRAVALRLEHAIEAGETDTNLNASDEVISKVGERLPLIRSR